MTVVEINDICWRINHGISILAEILRLVDFVTPTDELNALIDKLRLSYNTKWDRKELTDVFIKRPVIMADVLNEGIIEFDELAFDSIETNVLVDCLCQLGEYENVCEKILTELIDRNGITLTQLEKITIAIWPQLAPRWDNKIRKSMFRIGNKIPGFDNAALLKTILSD